MVKKNFIVLLVWIALCWCVFWQSLEDSDVEYVPWEVIIKYKDVKKSEIWLRKNSLSVSSLNFEADFDNLEMKDQLDESENIVLMEITDDKSVEEMVEALWQDSNIEYVEPNYIRYLFSDGKYNYSDLDRSKQWWLDYISWDEWYNAYSWRLQSNAVKVWVIDNGVNYNHSDLKDSMRSWNCKLDGADVECEHWYDFFHNTATPLPNEDTHWTHVAWIIAAWINNWTWIIWVNPHAEIVALKVWREKQFTTADEIKAINFAIKNGVKIINASYWSKAASSLERDAIMRFWKAWWLFVTAAGNDKLKNLDGWYSTYPCKYDLDNIICVAAIEQNWNLAYYSNYWKTSVDIAAPGSSIYSTVVKWNKLWKIYNGTFEECTKEDEILSGWNNGSCYKWSKDNSYAYKFTWHISSSSANLSNKKDIYLWFSIACDSESWIDVNVWYSNDWSGFKGSEIIWPVVSTWTRYVLDIWEDFYSDKFSFRLKSFEDGVEFSWICVIDDIEIYSDPYVVDDNDRFWMMSGTSMATPHVAWLASMIRAINPKLSYLDVKNFIIENGDENSDCKGKTVSWKTINVKKTLDAVVENIVSRPESLVSSWTWVIQWNLSPEAVNYYYEVLSWDSIVLSWLTGYTRITTNLSGSYKWKVQAIDEQWNKSKFSESFICEKPEFSDIVLSWYECSSLKLDLWIDGECMNMYNLVWDNSVDLLESTANTVSSLSSKLYIENWFGERTDGVQVNYIWENSLPTLNIKKYTYSSTITNWWEIAVWDLVSIFWAKDGECWSGNIQVKSISCNEWSATLNGNVLKIIAPTSKQWSADCNVEFQDDEWFTITWVFNYSFNTISKPTWWGWWGGWGWWWGGWGWWSSNKDKTQQVSDITEESQHGAAVNTGSTEEVKKPELQKPTMIELFEEDNKKSDFDFSWYNNSNPESVLTNWYSVEFNNAYTFAYKAWITTTNSIENANMWGKLTRIAMAKMLSNYAINILGKKPANKVVPRFPDVSSQLNEDYGWAVDLAYQLWIMWIWIDKFRPNDTVTRWEFATALSRMLYWTADWTPYYSTHLNKLFEEWIITNSDPKINELRWYVMIMLMRSAKNW